MKQCSSHIIQCLINNNIFPYANASSYTPDRIPQNALEIDSNSDFCGGTEEANGWWSVDFKTKILITQYQIFAKKEDGWIQNWKVEISETGEKWEKIDQQSTTCETSPTFNIKSPYSFRYFRIVNNGNSFGVDLPQLAFFYVKFVGLINNMKKVSCGSGNILLIHALIISTFIIS